MKRALSLALGLCAAGALFSSCASKPEVKIVLLDPCADSGQSFREAASYAEFVVTDTLWPEFRKPQLYEALEEYTRRHRRFGGL